MIASGEDVAGEPRVSVLVAEQAESLRKNGLDVQVGVVDDRSSLTGIRRNIRRLRDEVAGLGPRVVHAQYGSVVGLVGCLAAGGTPFVISFCGSDLFGTHHPGWRPRAREFLGRRFGLWAAHRAAHVIAKSGNLADALPASVRGKTTIVPNGVDLSLFTIQPRDECRSLLGWPLEKRIILFNASQRDSRLIKNPHLARAAVSLVKKDMPEAELRTLSSAPREQVCRMMNAADCLLCTSLHEGSPNVVKEAMACNLPVVSVPCGDVRERLDGVEPGGVYPYDPAALAGGLRAALDVGRRSNGRDALERQGLGSDSIAQRLIGIYETVAA